MCCTNCRTNQLKTQMKFSLTFYLESAMCGVGAENTHLERRGGVVYLHTYAKMEVTIVNKDYYTEDTPIRLGKGKETVLKFEDHTIKIFFEKSTLTRCSPPYPNLISLRKGTWITGLHMLKRIETTRVGSVLIFNKTKVEKIRREFIGLKKKDSLQWRINGGTVELGR